LVLFTFCVTALDVLTLKLGSPLYCTVIECAATERVAVTKVACPAASARVPRTFAPSMKVTLPIGVPWVEVTVAVNVTVSPKTVGVLEVVTVAFVLAGVTVCVMTDDVLVAWFGSPLYTAVIECEPPLSINVVMVAFPFPSSDCVPIELAPSLKVTLPVGVPALEATVAVNVTVCPKSDGFGSDVNVVVVLAGLTVWVSVIEVLAL